MLNAVFAKKHAVSTVRVDRYTYIDNELFTICLVTNVVNTLLKAKLRVSKRVSEKERETNRARETMKSYTYIFIVIATLW